MAEVVTGTIFDFDSTANAWHWYCGKDGCNARSNPPIAIKGRQRVTAVCTKCKAINQVARFK